MTSTATPPLQESSALTWQLVHAEPGALVYAVPGLKPTHPLVRHAAGRTGAWTPSGTLPAHAEHEKHSALHYAEYIGRVGVLAAALGVGAALAGQPAIAWAEPTDTDAGSSSTSTSADAESPSEPSQTSELTPTGTTSSAGDEQSSQTATETGGEASDTSTTLTAPGSTSPEVTISSSGGAQTSTTATEGDTGTIAETPAEAETPAPEPVGSAPEPVTEAPPTPVTPVQAAPTPETPAPAQNVVTPATGGSSTTPSAPRHATPSTSTPPTSTTTTAMLQAPATPTAAPTTAPTNGRTTPTTAAPAVQAATDLQASTTPATAAPGGLISRFVSIVLAPFSPVATTPAAQAVQTPVLWGLFAWIRRTYFNSTPTVSYDPTQTTQVDDTITGHLVGTDADGDALTYTATTPTNGGTVTFAPGGTFTYTAPASMYDTGGTDTFTVTATDVGSTAHYHGWAGLLNQISFGLLGNPGHTATTTVTLTVAAVNATPIPGTPAYTLGDVDHTTGTVLGELHVTDPDHDTLKYTVSGGPAEGTVDLDAVTGAFTYTPYAPSRHDAAATPAVDMDSFSVTVDDNHGGVISVPVSVAIDPANVPPTMHLVVSDPNSDGQVSVSVTVTDPDSDPVTYIVVHDPAFGTLTPTAGGFIYAPTPEARVVAAHTPGVDTDTFQLRASDLHGGVDEETATVIISPANIAPVAAGDSYTTNEDTPLTVAAPGVLANDTDLEHAALTVASHTPTAHGTLVLNANGSFTYTPSANWSGTDSFSYTVSDGVNTSTPATVTLTVNPVNDVPVASGDAFTTNEDTAVTKTLHATDVEGQTLTYAIAQNPTHGTITGLNTATGTYTYTPSENWSGADSFTYTASDGNLTSSPATVTITVGAVNDAPMASGDTFTTNEDTAVTKTLPATDVDNPALTYAITQDPTHGTITGLNTTTGTYTYTPAANYNGADSFTYTATDSEGASDTATVAITVGAVNDAPVATGDSYTTDEDTAVTKTLPATDVDNPALTYAITQNPTHGTITGFNTTTGTYTYTPNQNWSGADSFTYTATDSEGASDTATVAITVGAVNDAPVATGDSYTTNEDTAVTKTLPATDVDNPALTYAITQNPTHGTITGLDTATGTYTYTPAANYNGTDSFTYTATDPAGASDTATVDIFVSSVLDAPVARDDNYTTNEDTAVSGNVLANDTDIEGTTLTAALGTPPAHGTVDLMADGYFTYTPAANYSGPDSFTYRATNQRGTTVGATVTIAVGAVNDAPVATGDSYTINEDTPVTKTLPATDVDNPTLTYAITQNPSHGTITGLNTTTGTYTYTPAANYNGTDSFTYTATDPGGASDTASVAITVTPMNDLPVAVGDAYTTNEDTALTVNAPGVLANDTDVEGGPLYARLGTPPAHGTVVLNANGSFTYTPADNYNGADSFTYITSDDPSFAATSSPATVAITVTPVNDAPIATGDSYTTNEDTPLTVAAPGVLANDTDAEGNPLTAAVVSGPAHGTLVLNGNGSFTYTPVTNYNGTDSFTYTAFDGTNASDAATVAITVVREQNLPPTAVHDTYTTAEDTTLVVSSPGVLTNDTDPNIGDTPLTAVPGTGPQHGSLVLAADGSFTYTPEANFNGVDSFTYGALDTNGAVGYTTVDITVTPVNDAPVAAGDAFTTAEDTAVTKTLPAADVDNPALTYAIAQNPTHGTITGFDTTTGAYTYTPAANYNGADSFSYTAYDGNLTSSPATVNITVTAVNDAPVFNVVVGTPDPVTGKVGLTVTASDAEGDPIIATPITNFSKGTLTGDPATGIYTYTPNLTSRLRANGGGADAVDSFTVAISDEFHAPFNYTVNIPVSAAGLTVSDNVPAPGINAMVVNSDGSRAYLANEIGAVIVVDSAGNQIGSPIMVGGQPTALALDGTRVYVTSAGTNTVTVIDTTTNDVVDTDIEHVGYQPISVGNDPRGIAINPNAHVGYVTNYADGTVSVFDTQTLKVVDTVTVGANPWGVAHGWGKIYVTNSGDGTVSVIETMHHQVIDTIRVGSGPIGVATQPLAGGQGWTRTAFVVNSADSTVSVIHYDEATGEHTVVGDPIPVGDPGSGPYGVVLSPDGDIAYVSIPGSQASGYDGTVIAIDANTRTVLDTDFRSAGVQPVDVGTAPLNMAVNPSTGTLYVINKGDNTISVVNLNPAAAPINSAPVAVGNAVNTAEDISVLGNVLIDDTDVDGGTLTVASHTDPAHGTLTLNPDGTFVYSPAADYNGADSFTYVATDGIGRSNPATVAITIASTNDAPVAVDDAVSTFEDNAVSGNVLANDTDVEGNTPLTATLVDGPAHGTLNFNTDGTFTYTPAQNWSGADSFTYTATDSLGATSNEATVAITVTPVNDAPLINSVTSTPGTGNSWTVVVDPADVDPEDFVIVTVTAVDADYVTVTEGGTGLGSTQRPYVVTVTDAAWAKANPGAQLRVIVTATDSHSAPVVTTRAIGTVNNAAAIGYYYDGQTDIPALPAGLVYTDIAGGGTHTVLLRSDGSAVGTGNNYYGQITIPDLPTGLTYTDIAAGYQHTVLLRSDGTAVAIGYDNYGQTDIPELDTGLTYTQVAAGDYHTVLLRSDGTAVAVGRSDWGRTSIPDLPPGVTYTDIAASSAHTVLLRSNGTAVAVGYNGSGQTDIPALPAGLTYTDIAAGGNHTVLLRSDGTAVGTGNNYHGETTFPALPTGLTYTDIAAGAWNTVLLRSDGTVFAVGWNTFGQNTIPDLPAGLVYTDIAAGANHTVLLSRVNTAPVIGDTAYTVETAHPHTGIVDGLLHVTDPDNDTVSYAVTGTPTQGKVTVNPDGSFRYDPTDAARLNAGLTPETDTDSFTVTVTDNYGAHTPVTVTGIPVTPAQFVNTAAIPVGDNPARMAVSPDGTRAYVPNFDSGTISVINTATNTVINTVTVGVRPFQVAVTPDGTRAYVTNMNSNTVTVINTATNGTSTIDLAPFGSYAPQALAISPDGTRAYVASESTPVIVVIDTTTNTVVDTNPGVGGIQPINIGNRSYAVAFSPDGTKAYVSNAYVSTYNTGTVSVINTATYGVTAVIPVGPTPLGVAVTPSGGRVYVTDNNSSYVRVINTSTNAVSAYINVGSPSQQVTVSPDGSLAYVTNFSSGAVSVIDTATNTVRGTIPVGTGPLAVAVSPDGSHVYAVNRDSKTVSVITLADNIAPVAGDPTSAVSNVDTATGIVTGSVKVTDAEGDTLSYAVTTAPANGTVTFGPNGSFTYDPSDAARLHAQETPGTDGFTVTVTDGYGGATPVTVTGLPISPAEATVKGTVSVGTSPTVVAVSPDGTRAYVANPGAGTVSVVNTATNAVINTITVGGNPNGIALNSAGTRLYVPNTTNNTLSVYDTSSYNRVGVVGVGANPTAVAVNPAGTRAYVAGWNSNTVSVVDLTNNTLITHIQMGTRPGGLAVSPDGARVYVANYDANSVSVIDTATNTVTQPSISVGYTPYDVAFSPDGARAYVLNSNGNSVSVINAVTRAVTATISVGSPSGLTVSPDGSVLYVSRRGGSNSVTAIDTATNAAIGSPISVGNSPGDMVVSPDGSRIYVTNTGSNNVSVIRVVGNSAPVVGSPAYAIDSVDPTTGAVHGTVYASDPDGDPITYGAVGPTEGRLTLGPAGTFTYVPSDALRLRASVTPGPDTVGFTMYVSDVHNATTAVPVDIPVSPESAAVADTISVSPQPLTVAISPNGSRAYTVIGSNNTLAVIDTSSNKVMTYIPVGNQPFGVSVSPNGGLAYVTNSGSNTVTAVNTGTNATTTFYSGGVGPYAVAFSPDSSHAYVTNSGSNTVSIINTATNAVESTILVAPNPKGIVMSPDGTRAYVASQIGVVSVIDMDSHAVTPISGFNAPVAVTLSRDGAFAYVVNSGDGSVSVIDMATNGVITTIPTGGANPVMATVGGDGSLLYVVNNGSGTVTAIDTVDNTVVTTIPVGSLPVGVAVSSGGDYVYIVNSNSSTVSVITVAPSGL